MGRRIFGIFVVFIATVISLAFLYIHSESFARLLKFHLDKNLSQQEGIKLDFDHVNVGIFPPSLALVNAKISVLDEKNPLHLKKNTTFSAEKLGVSFPMFQAFSRGMAINQVFLTGAKVYLEVPETKSVSKDKPGPSIDELLHQSIKIKLSDNFYLTIRQFEINESEIYVSWQQNEFKNFLDLKKTHYVAITPDPKNANIVMSLEEAVFSIGKTKQNLQAVKVNADLRQDSILLNALDLQRAEAALHASGEAKGTLAHAESLHMNFHVIARGNNNDLSDLVPVLDKASFQFEVDLNVSGTPDVPALEGKCAISKIKYSLWDLDRIDTEVQYANHELLVNSLALQKGVGKISLLNKLSMNLPIRGFSQDINLKFSNVDLSSFAGDLNKSINNLGAKINGEVLAKLQVSSKGDKPKLDSLSLVPKIAIDDFELNNQTYGKKRPYRRIFKLRHVELLGDLTFKNGALSINEGSLNFQSGKMTVSGGVAAGMNFNIFASSSNIDLGAEVGDIAGIPLTGSGSMGINVHGPGDKILIDFDLDQKNAKYVHFDFGDLLGRVTYDDDKSYIYISAMQGKKNASTYTLSGSVNVGEGSNLDLQAKFLDATPDDVFTIFAHQLENISWIPHGMTGLLSADIKVGGGYEEGLNSLKIDAALSGKKLSYKGESLNEVTVNAGVAKGDIFAKNFVGKKYGSEVTGYITYSKNGVMDYSLQSDRAKVRNLDHVVALDLPLDGALSFKSSGKGTWEDLDSTTTLTIDNFFVRTREIPAFNMSLKTGPARDTLEASLGNDEATAKMLIAKKSTEESSSSFQLKQANFNYVLCLLNRSICNDPATNLMVNADMHTQWHGTEWKKMNGAGTVKDFVLEKSGFALRNHVPAHIEVENGEVKSSTLNLEGEDSALKLSTSGRVDGSDLSWTAQGKSSLHLLEFVNAIIDQARGALTLDISAVGSFDNTKFAGDVAIKNGFLRLVGLDATVDNLQGKIDFDGNRATIDDMNAQMGGGSVQVSGYADIYLNKPPKFNLELFLANNRLKFYPVNYVELSEAKLSLTGDSPPYLFGGLAKIREVMMRNSFGGANGQKALQNARYLPEKVAGSSGFYQLKIRALAEDKVFVQNDLFDAEFKGEMTLLNNFEFPQMVARAELVKGKLLFRNTPFTLDHASVSLPTPEYFNPQFSVGGAADVDGYRINIFASGTADAPKITFSSSPSLPQEDIISLVAFGFKGDDTDSRSKMNSTNTSAIGYSEVSSILLDQLKLSQDLQSKGVKLGIAPSVIQTEANVIRPNSAPDTVAPKVYLQTELLKKLDASFGSTVGATQGQALDANLQYKLGDKASLNAIYEQIPPDIDATERNRNSYGADLKFHWGFK